MITANKSRILEMLNQDQSIRRHIRARAGDQHSADDVMQQVLVLVYDNLDCLHDPRKLKAWVFSIAKNEIIRNRRRRLRFADGGSVPSPCSSHPMELLELEDILRRTLHIDHFYTKTERPVAEFLITRALEETDSGAIRQEMRQQFGHSAEYVHTLVCRVRKKIKTYLSQHGY